MRIEIASDYWVEYIPGFYETDEADQLLRSLLSTEMTPEIVRMLVSDTNTKRQVRAVWRGLHLKPSKTPLMAA